MILNNTAVVPEMSTCTLTVSSPKRLSMRKLVYLILQSCAHVNAQWMHAYTLHICLVFLFTALL